jgi:hypothetical protein
VAYAALSLFRAVLPVPDNRLVAWLVAGIVVGLVGLVDVVVFLWLAGRMRVREVTTVLDTVLGRLPQRLTARLRPRGADRSRGRVPPGRGR